MIPLRIFLFLVTPSSVLFLFMFPHRDSLLNICDTNSNITIDPSYLKESHFLINPLSLSKMQLFSHTSCLGANSANVNK
jgi:hypothetical protein